MPWPRWLALLDTQGRYCCVNHALFALLDYARDELLGRSARETRTRTTQPCDLGKRDQYVRYAAPACIRVNVLDQRAACSCGSQSYTSRWSWLWRRLVRMCGQAAFR